MQDALTMSAQPPQLSAIQILQRAKPVAGALAAALPTSPGQLLPPAAAAAAAATTSSPPPGGAGGAAGYGASGYAPAPSPAAAAGWNPKKAGVRKVRFKIPADLPPDRRVMVPACDKPGKERPHFVAAVPPGAGVGQIWHFRARAGEAGAEWEITETIKIEAPKDESALPGAGLVYECTSRAVLRVGLDRASKQIGFIERGEQHRCLEKRIYSGRVRVRFECGWTSVKSGSGKKLLKQLDSLAPWLQAEEEAKQRAVDWLALQGYSAEMVQQMLELFREAGYKPTSWLERLGDMSGEELVQLVSEAKQAQRKEMELAGYMQEAGEQLLRADYAGAMRKFKEVLEVDPDNEEAKRGHQEAEKGERLASMSPEELEAAVMGGMDSTSLVQALGVTEGREASATAKQFDPTKKLPKRVPHHPDKPYDAGIKGPTFFTVCWHQSKEDISTLDLPLPMQHQIQYGAPHKGDWLEAPWDGDVQGQMVAPPPNPDGGNGSAKISIGMVRPGRKWSCRIEGLSPGEKHKVRVRSKNERGWGKWSWNSKIILTTLE